MKEYNKAFARFKKAAIAKAIEDGYFDSAADAKEYELTCDGQFHLLKDQFCWFSTGIKFEDFEQSLTIIQF